MLRLAAARNAASFGLEERCAARSAPLACWVVPRGSGDAVRLIVSVDGDGARWVCSSGDAVASSAMPSSRACDKSRPMPSIERGEGRKLTDGRREDGPSTVAVLVVVLGPCDVGVGLSASDSDTSSSSVSRADMERDSRSLRPPSAARMAGRPSATPLDAESIRGRDWDIDGRRDIVTFKLVDGRREGGAGKKSLEGRRDAAGDKEGRAGVDGPSWP